MAEHVPVLLEETLSFLEPERGGVFVDCTVGLGGHAEPILAASDAVRLVGVDRDPAALAACAERLARFSDRVELVEAEFEELPRVVAELGIVAVAGILADLGVSSMQLDRAERGFSFRRQGPLDMRMGRSELTAEEIVNRYPEEQLEKIFREYGEERRARRIARAVVAARSEKPIATTTELASLIAGAVGGGGPRRIDPATRVFQALRIEVNRELAGLSDFVRRAVELLETDGRLVMISYHSLEDRPVKHTLRRLERGEVDEVTGRPRAETRLIELLTKKPVRPRADEVMANPRSRSARLRAARRI